jgi:hypothetical protein
MPRLLPGFQTQVRPAPVTCSDIARTDPSALCGRRWPPFCRASVPRGAFTAERNRVLGKAGGREPSPDSPFVNTVIEMRSSAKHHSV